MKFKQKAVKTQNLVFYHLIDTEKPLLFFEITGGEKDVDEATERIRNQVSKMQNYACDEKQETPKPTRKYQY